MKLPVLPFRLRIALLSAAVSGIVLIGFGIVAWLGLHHERLAALDREIRALAYRHPGWMNPRSNYERLGSAIEFIFGEARKSRLILLALDTGGNVRFRSEHWPGEIVPASLDLALADDPGAEAAGATPSGQQPADRGEGSGTGVEPHGPGMGPRRGVGGWGENGLGTGGGAGGGASLFTKVPRFLTRETASTSWRLGILGNARDRLVVGLDCAEMNAELGRMRLGFLVALPLALVLIGGGGWWVAGQAVRPLRSISQAAELVTARGLDQRITVPSEDPEIDRLVVVLNRMMDRLETSFRQATRFSADASHELKTPLAVMQGELEQALQSAPDGSREQELFASLLDETQRLKTITRSLLLLAQADSGRLPLSPEALEVGAMIEVIAADARILAEEAGLSLEARICSGVQVSADRVLLRLAVSNLVGNAVHYNQPGGRVDLTCVADGADVTLEVSNTGAGIPPEERSRVFDRFHRGREARAVRHEGLGLGLSLAREIVLAHRGELTLVEGEAGRTVFRLRLPRLVSGEPMKQFQEEKDHERNQ
jgi:heavy metal sensor kinase